MKITICGLAGTGTSTLGKELARVRGYDYLSSGDVFRAKAAEFGMDLNAFEELCKEDEQYDKQLDQDIQAYGEHNDDIVVESRLAWHFIPNSFKIKLTCDFDTRVARIAERDGIPTTDARDKTIAREQAIRERYHRYYGIQTFDADEHFDVVFDTTHQPVDRLLREINTILPTKS